MNTKNKGFTLLELVIGIAIIGLILFGIATAMNGGDEAKVTAVLSKAEEYSNAIAIYKRNTGCVPNNLAVLFNRSNATATNNFCGENTSANYGPHSEYTKPLPLDDSSRAKLDGLGLSGATVSIYRDGISPYNYMLKFEQLGESMVQNLVAKCNGISPSEASTSAIANPIFAINLDTTRYTCRGNIATGQVDFRFARF